MNMASQDAIRSRLMTSLVTLILLAFTGFHSAIASLATLLRDRARSGLHDPTSPASVQRFENIQNNIAIGFGCASVISAMGAIYGAIATVFPRHLREDRGKLFMF